MGNFSGDFLKFRLFIKIKKISKGMTKNILNLRNLTKNTRPSQLLDQVFVLPNQKPA